MLIQSHILERFSDSIALGDQVASLYTKEFINA
jgi:hypothetical protein